jgi:hypothetical protein
MGNHGDHPPSEGQGIAVAHDTSRTPELLHDRPPNCGEGLVHVRYLVQCIIVANAACDHLLRPASIATEKQRKESMFKRICKCYSPCCCTFRRYWIGPIRPATIDYRCCNVHSCCYMKDNLLGLGTEAKGNGHDSCINEKPDECITY